MYGQGGWRKRRSHRRGDREAADGNEVGGGWREVAPTNSARESRQPLPDEFGEVRAVAGGKRGFVDVTATLQLGEGQTLIESFALVSQLVDIPVDQDAPVQLIDGTTGGRVLEEGLRDLGGVHRGEALHHHWRQTGAAVVGRVEWSDRTPLRPDQSDSDVVEEKVDTLGRS